VPISGSTVPVPENPDKDVSVEATLN
jgi:hypothetical protein